MDETKMTPLPHPDETPPRFKVCQDCRGSGTDRARERCPECGGLGGEPVPELNEGGRKERIMTTKLTATDHRKRQGAMTFRPMKMSEDGKTIYHAANSRRFKCPCRAVYDWTHDGHYRGEVVCACGLQHLRGNDLTPRAE